MDESALDKMDLSKRTPIALKSTILSGGRSFKSAIVLIPSLCNFFDVVRPSLGISRMEYPL